MSPVTESLPAAREQAAPQAAPTPRLNRRAIWDLLLAIAGLVYVVLILWLSLDTPLFSLLFVSLAAHQLFCRRGASP
jgi:fatty acid desaturase